MSLLVVAGEPSGDRAAASVVQRLDARAFGLVGDACASVGADPVARIDRAALGVLDVAARAAHVALAMRAIRRAIDQRKPNAALLVNYTDFNARLLGFLRRRGVRVVWYAAPQIWAWRASRGSSIAKNIDAMAVILPFEEELWRNLGTRTRYVGHPSMEIARRDRDEARAELGVRDHAIAILPGSRPREVERLLPSMLEAVSHESKNAHVILTRALDHATQTWARDRAERAGVRVHEITTSAMTVLSAFDIALTASGTASLECAMCDVPPVVAYRVDAVAAFVARRALRTPHIALPNVLLGRRAFPELTQDDATSVAMSRALDSLRAKRDNALTACDEVRRVLGVGHVPSRAVAEIISPWLPRRKSLTTLPKSAPQADKRTDPAVFTLLFITVIMLGVRLYASKLVGYGDSEALYATYALHPQPAYLDHPGLVGIFASSLGGGALPSPLSAHVATAALASMFPWLVVIVSRRLGADVRTSAIAGIVMAAVPEIGIGLFAMTPDLLLAWTWIAFIGVAALALESDPNGGTRTASLFAFAGVIAGVASSAKVTGVLLLPVLIVTVILDKRHARTIWPWVGMLIGCIPIGVIAQYEAAHHFPMLRHRFVDTQQTAGFSLRNIGALFGGQIVYVSPIIVLLAVIVLRDLIRRRNDDVITRFLFWSFAIPIVPLTILCLWSRVAEPHWLAPPLLALPVHAARRLLPLSKKLITAGIVTGLAMVVAVHAWILSPSLVRYAPKSYDPKVDITNELYGWQQATRAINEIVDEETYAHAETWLVGPSWMVCAQLQSNLPGANVGCATSVRSDFDDWSPREKWEHADILVFVTDDRMAVDAETISPKFHVARTERITILRGGRIARTFRISVLERRAAS